MTRFWITLDQGVRFVIQSIEEMQGGEVFVPKIPSMNIMDLAKAISPDCRIQNIGIRPGEKIHEVLISADEAIQAREFDDKFVILPTHPWWQFKDKGRRLPDGFCYRSDNNTKWLTLSDLHKLVEDSQ
jgi:UDP-N-acetylglucosamine 4,6-dehydratase